MSQYSEKLKDPRWQKKRLEIFQRDEFCCQLCFDSESTLHVHHRRYFPNTEPWDYEDVYLVTLCEKCHAAEQEGWADAWDYLKEAFINSGYFSSQVYAIADAFTSTKEHPLRFIDAIYAVAVHDEERKRLLDLHYKRSRGVQPGHASCVGASDAPNAPEQQIHSQEGGKPGNAG